MDKLLIVASRFLLLCSVLLPFVAEGADFVVNANQDLPGLDTGISFNSGDKVTITASGQASFGPGSTQYCNTSERTVPDGHRITENGTLCDPKIDTLAVLPSAPVGELLAKIGTSEWFPVGSSYTGTATSSGRLFLLYNDVTQQYGNDSGAYQCSVAYTGAAAQPSPGWYSNSGFGTICENCAGAVGHKIVWQNSYIYPHPGNDNLYWYAEVIHVNTSSQPITISCVGNNQSNPSLVKEHIRGTEGIPPNGDGYVSSDEYTCSRNPNFAFTLQPGEYNNNWAIFHNVPPGGEVSLEWGAKGSSPWVNPWQTPFQAPPPAVCPPELVTLGTCQPR